MPELNLIEEESSSAPSSSAKRKAPPSGGGVARLLTIILILVVIVAGLFLLNKYGIVKIWGKKAPPIAEVQPESPPVDPFAQEPAPAEQAPDTSATQLIETPPLEEQAPPAETAPEPQATMPGMEAGGKLAEMKGNYTVQVSAWKDRVVADDMVKRLDAAGYPAFVEERELKSGVWYTVRIGKYQTRKEASAAVQTFAAELKEHYWIDRIRVH